MTPIRRVAFIGCGKRAQAHAAAVRAESRGRLIAVADVKEETARGLAAGFGADLGRMPGNRAAGGAVGLPAHLLPPAALCEGQPPRAAVARGGTFRRRREWACAAGAWRGFPCSWSGRSPSAANGRWLPVTRVWDLRRGLVDEYPFQTYVISPDGLWAAVRDIARNPRRGYAYALPKRVKNACSGAIDD